MRSFLEEQRDHQSVEAKSEIMYQECKIDSLNTIYHSNISKTNSFQSFGNNHGYEADESTRKRLDGTLHKDHEDHIAGKGFNPLKHCNLVHKFILKPEAMTILDAKTAVDRHGS